MTRVLCVLFGSVCLAVAATVGADGSVIGSLNGEDGTAVVGGRVALLSLAPDGHGKPQQKLWITVSGTGGVFHFDGLPQGGFKLCSQAPSTVWLNPCEWGLNPPVVSLFGPQPVASVSMVLKKGVVVPIRVDDPGQFLSNNEGKTPGARLMLAVKNDADAICLAHLVSQDANGRNYQVVIPYNTTVQLVVQSSFFKLSDANGAPVATASPFVPVSALASQSPSTVHVVVTGGGPR